MQHSYRVGIIPLILWHALFSLVKLEQDFVKILALQESRLGSVKVDVDAIRLILFPRLD